MLMSMIELSSMDDKNIRHSFITCFRILIHLSKLDNVDIFECFYSISCTSASPSFHARKIAESTSYIETTVNNTSFYVQSLTSKSPTFVEVSYSVAVALSKCAIFIFSSSSPGTTPGVALSNAFRPAFSTCRAALQ